MRRIREALRLHLQAGLSYCEVGRALKISKSAVDKYVSLARVAGVDCVVAEGLTDEELEARLYLPPVARSSHQLASDFAVVHQELKRPGVTLMLLWEESTVPKAGAYGGVLFDARGRTLLREPAKHYGGYVWTFAKGKPDAGESPEQTALREVLEETGFTCRVIGALTKAYQGSTPSTSAFFLMEPVGAQGKIGCETAQTKWVDLEEARMLISLTTKPTGVVRDLAILDDAMAAMASIKAAGEPSERHSA
jgi:8-oxo-dGTP pyrophosphatase MutT (NUDIX family)